MAEKKIKMKDRDGQIHEFMCCLRMAGIHTDYLTTEMIWKLFHEYKLKGGNFDLNTAVKMQSEHEKKWDEYFKKTENEN